MTMTSHYCPIIGQYLLPNRSHLKLKALSILCCVVLIWQYFYFDYFDYTKYFATWRGTAPIDMRYFNNIDRNRLKSLNTDLKIIDKSVLAGLETTTTNLNETFIKDSARSNPTSIDLLTEQARENMTVLITVAENRIATTRTQNSLNEDVRNGSMEMDNNRTEIIMDNNTISSTKNPKKIQKNVLARSSNSLQEFEPADPNMELCPLTPPVLVGPIKVWFDYPSWSELNKLYENIEPGGHGKPATCVSRNRVAIVIPYRNRDQQLRAFLHNMHSLLTKQQLDYGIFIVEQIGNQTFNRGKLMNVGFVEAMKLYDWQCAIFHDVDLLPEDDRNFYTCPDQPRHMSVAVDKFGYQLPYSDIFGGISAMTKEQFTKINGFSNDYWGWGGEDDDLSSRVKLHGYHMSRYSADIARYKMIKHHQESSNPVNKCRFNLMYKVQRRWPRDGLSTLNYSRQDRQLKPLFTWLLVDLLEHESRKKLADEGWCR